MRVTALSFFIFILCIGSPMSLQAQIGITAVPFVENNEHARSKALGSATVALPHHAGGTHLNPAVIGSPGRAELSTQFSGNSSFPFLGASYPVFDSRFYMPSLSYATDKWAMSYQMMYFYWDRGRIRTPTNPSGYEAPANHEQAHTVAFARQISDYISLGAGVNFIRSTLAGSRVDVSGPESRTASAISVDLGAYGEYPIQVSENVHVTPSAGWSLTDFGSMMKYQEDQSSDPLPMTMRGGFGVRLEYVDPLDQYEFLKNKTPLSIGLYRSFDKVLAGVDEETGEAMGPFDALFKSWDPVSRGYRLHSDEYPLGKQIGNQGGMEITLFEHVSLRQGFSRAPEVEGSGTNYSFGFGLMYNVVRLDYFQMDLDAPDRQVRRFWQLTASFPLEQLRQWFQ